MSKAKKNTQKEPNQATEEETSTLAGEIIEVPWDEIKAIYNLKTRVEDLENRYAEISLRYDKIKADLMNRIMNGESHLYKSAEELRNSKNIDRKFVYELKLPANPQEKGYFLRKETSPTSSDN